jgi:hypothetical protein
VAQIVLPLSAAYSPTPHDEQMVAPVASTYVPARHSAQPV